jgi:magnesium chelatase subunit I
MDTFEAGHVSSPDADADRGHHDGSPAITHGPHIASKSHLKTHEPRKPISFPFTAIVGQDDMKNALVLASIDPTIGGVLVMGDRGTGKSTCVRGLAAVLPTVSVVADCPYACHPADWDQQCGECRETVAEERGVCEVPVPVVDLPIGATEDRVVGSLDIEQALLFGKKRFQPGLLAKANRGFLYIDEINLLDDYLVDLLLDVAASGEHVVEREGLSVRHPARFVLIGSGNPEEGELRPQLLDRFGLSVDVTSPTDLAQRVEAVKRRDAFDRDKSAFAQTWEREEAALRERIVTAQAHLESVEVPDDVLEYAAKLCLALGSDGLRGELTLLRSARALAAFEGEPTVTADMIRRVAPMTLSHRLRKDPLDDTSSNARIARVIDDLASE